MKKQKFPSYYNFWHILGSYSLKFSALLILFFLIMPILVIVPLSFNIEPFFTFTKGMVMLKPEAYSLRWYEAIITNENWILAIKNSFFIGFFATIIATALGTLAAVGLASQNMPFKRYIMALMLSPMIVPLIIIAAGMFFFYSKFELAGTYTGLIISHAALGVPFVIITVTATLSSFNRSLYFAGLSLGASYLKTFFDVVVPIIRPGVISGAMFAFVTSFDEVVLVLFLAGPGQRTIPRQMFSGLREQINPTILAVATLLIVLAITFLITLEFLRRRSERLRGFESF